MLKKDIIEWDVLNWSVALEIWQPVIDSLPKNARILAVGERRGGLALWLALQGFHVVCTDRTDPIIEAHKLHEKYHVAGNIEYQALDITQPQTPGKPFDLIIMKSVLGGLKTDYSDPGTRNAATQKTAISNIRSLLKPGGYFLTADNLMGSRLIHSLRKSRQKNRGWHYFQLTELKELLSIFSSGKTYTFGVIPGLFPSSLLNSIAYFSNRYLLRWLPAKTRYIGITIARN